MRTTLFISVILLNLLSLNMNSQQAAMNTSVVSNCGCPGEVWSFTTPYKPWVYFPTPNNSKRLMHTSYGFNIPATASITGVLVEMGYTTLNVTGNTLKDSLVMLLVNGSMAGEDKSPSSPYLGTSGTLSYGGPTDTWGILLSPADVNSPGFGFNFKLFSSVANSQLTVANGASITIHYNNAAGLHEWQTALGGVRISSSPDHLKVNFEKATNSHIQILDINGKLSGSGSFENTNEAYLNIENLRSGIYIYRVASGKEVRTGKFIKE